MEMFWEIADQIASVIFVVFSIFVVLLSRRVRKWLFGSLPSKTWNLIVRLFRYTRRFLKWVISPIVKYREEVVNSDFYIPESHIQDIVPAILHHAYVNNKNQKFIDLAEKDPLKALRKSGIELKRFGTRFKVVEISGQMAAPGESNYMRLLIMVNEMLGDEGRSNEIETSPVRYTLGFITKRYHSLERYPKGIVGTSSYQKNGDKGFDYKSALENSKDYHFRKEYFLAGTRMRQIARRAKELVGTNKVLNRGDSVHFYANGSQISIWTEGASQKVCLFSDIEKELSKPFNKKEDEIILELAKDLILLLPHRIRKKHPMVERSLPFEDNGRNSSARRMMKESSKRQSVCIVTSDGQSHKGFVHQKVLNNLFEYGYSSVDTVKMFNTSICQKAEKSISPLHISSVSRIE